jgi:hypothetical protein
VLATKEREAAATASAGDRRSDLYALGIAAQLEGTMASLEKELVRQKHMDEREARQMAQLLWTEAVKSGWIGREDEKEDMVQKLLAMYEQFLGSTGGTVAQASPGWSAVERGG